MDTKCKSLLIQCISNSHLQYVKEKRSAYQMWIALESVFQRKGIASQLYLRRKLLSMKVKEEESLEKHFITFEETIRELKSVGGKLEEVDIVCHLLLTLPNTYDSIVTALETLDAEKLKLEFVKGKLLDHEIKIKNREEIRSDSSTFWSSVKKNNGQKKIWKEQRNYEKPRFKCYGCGKFGHKQKDCRFKKEANQAKKEDEEDKHIIFLTSTSIEEEDSSKEDKIKWYLDSGATVNSDKYFSEVSELKNPIKICVAKSNESLYATKIGSIAVMLNPKENITAEIKNVLFVENQKEFAVCK